MTFNVVLSIAFVKQTTWNSFLVVNDCSTQKEERENYKNILLFAQSACFGMHFFYKNLVVVLHDNDTFRSLLKAKSLWF